MTKRHKKGTAYNGGGPQQMQFPRFARPGLHQGTVSKRYAKAFGLCIPQLAILLLS